MCQTTTVQPGRAIGQHPQTPQGGSPPHIPQWAHPSPAPRLIAEGRVSRCACPLSLPAHSHTIPAVETHPSTPQQEYAQSPLGARCVDIVDGSHASSRTSSSATVASPRLRHAHHHAQCHHACAPVVFAMCCCLTCSTPPLLAQETATHLTTAPAARRRRQQKPVPAGRSHLATVGHREY